MITISLCMIVKNEEAVIRRCIESIYDAVDEIIIVDTGSSDKTKEIARSMGCETYDFEWIDDFSAARNFAYSKAKMDYQLWLDADDVVESIQKRKLMALKETLDTSFDMVTMKYDTHFDSNGNAILSSIRERLTKTSNHYKWKDPVHECIPLSGHIFHSDIRITHKKMKQEGVSLRNIKIYENLENTGKLFTPRQQYYFARELSDHRLYPKAIYYFEKFLDEGLGWEEDNIASCLLLSNCYSELHDEKKSLNALIRSFNYDSPRPEICCAIGYYYKIKQDYRKAAHWFETALTSANNDSMGFITLDNSGYIPHLELCVCYFNLNEYEKANYHNEKAGEFKKNDRIVKNNKSVFKKLINQNDN